MLLCLDENHMVLLSNKQINKCCLAADFWVIAVVLRSTCGAMFSQDFGIVTALVNMVCSFHNCNYCSWEGTHVNHIIS